MIDLSWSHILIVLVVALVVVGPKDLPRLMRMVGQWLAKARAMADQFRKSFDEMARQAELDDLRREIQALRSERPFASFEQTLHEPVLPSQVPPHDAAPVLETAEQPLEIQHDAAPAEPIPPGAEPPPP
ncbi:MAG TPA: Sec-independent protein translocase protein TatB [Rhizomicrobium sp.]|jgi:sec-independent protein translocase protein TatB